MTVARPAILFVDDEPAVLEGLRHAMRPDRRRWDVRFASSGAEGLASLAADGADVIVSDMRMPEMDGLQFLRSVQQQRPEATRIVLSGYADLAAVAQASAVAHQYLLKPCDAEVLRGTIERALALRALLQDERLKRAVGSLGALPSAPHIYRELTEALGDPNVEVKRLAKIVQDDMGMSSRVLQFVNSAYYGLAHRISSIESAIVYLGLNTLRHLAVTLEVYRTFGGGSELEMVQRHSLLVARIARRLAGDPTRGEAAFSAGLLHDSGKLILASRMGERYVAVRDHVRRGAPLAVAEREVFGTDHAAVGAYLLGMWGLPHSIVEAVAFHHTPQTQGDVGFGGPALVALANALAHDALAEPQSDPDSPAVLALGTAGYRELAKREAESLAGERGKTP